MGWMSAVRRLGRSDQLLLAALALSLGLTLRLFWPTLHDGLFADDYVAMAMIDGRFAAPRSPLDLFAFANGRADDVARLQRLGSLPWWAPPDFRVSFLRPLSSALWHVDRALFGHEYALYHAHSLLVFFLLVIATGWLYRELLPGTLAALAVIMFAVDDSHQFPVVWLSNRGGIYASLCGVLALLAHVRWRTRGERRYAALSAAAISVGFAFGEWALPMLAYIFAFELAGARGPLRARALALLPSLAPTLVFLALRAALHYGARGSGAYIDPGVEPLRFFATLSHRIPVFVADMMWNVPSEWWDQGSPWRDELLGWALFAPSTWVKLPDWHFFHVLLGLLGFAAIGFGLWFCGRGLRAEEKRHVRWLLLGALGALVPVVGSFPSTRLTIASYLGVAPLLACVLREVARRLRAAPRFQPLRFAGYYVILLALIHVQFVLPLSANVQGQVNHYATTARWVQAAELDPQRVAGQRVFLISGSEFTTSFYFAYIWAHRGLQPLPRSYYPLTVSPSAHFVERTAENELVMRALGGPYLGSGHENMFSSSWRRWYEGQVTQLDGLRVRAELVQKGLPGVLRLTFDKPLEDPSYVFLTAKPYGLVRYKPPPLGSRQLLARAANPNWPILDRHHYLVRIAPLPEMLRYAPMPGMVCYKPPS
jgi:hypothetical protein